MKIQLLLFLFASIVLFNHCHQSTDSPQPPNIIIFLADDLGYNDISVYRRSNLGQSDQPPTCQTPQVDQLAKEGMRFTQFYAGAAVCSPSRAALITGRNTTRVGIYNWIPENCPMHLREEEVTIAEMLKTQGYQTGHFGKWHLTSQGMGQPIPNDQGFDYSFFAYNNAQPSHRNPNNYFRNGEPVGELEGYACQLVAEEAINWLDQADQYQPFYLNIWFNEPHVKLAAPDSLTTRHEYNSLYYGAIENMDDAIGRVLEYLEEKGLDENTIVIFTSDNGSQEMHSNDPLQGRKAFNYEGGIREPFIIKYPGVVPADKINEVPGSFTDVLPTISDFTGIPMPNDRTIDGMSLAGIMSGDSAEIERNEPFFFFRYFHDPICMLREGDWCLLGYNELIPYTENLNTRELAKLKPAEGEPTWSQWGFQENHMTFLDTLAPKYFELYDLEKDPAQETDLAAAYPKRVEEMKAKMLQLRAEMIEEGGNWYE